MLLMNENAAADKLDQESSTTTNRSTLPPAISSNITISSGSSTASISQTRRETEEVSITYSSDKAHKVITRSTSLIKDCGIDLRKLVDKLLEHEIINEDEKRDIIDGYTRQTAGERMDELLRIISSSIKMDGEVFGIFIDILRKEGTRRMIALADKLMERYNDN